MSDQYNVQPGTIFASDFRIDRPMSQGGMGAVYIAEQLSTGKQRALKVMLPALVSDPALRKRFEQEARIGSMIESEHVVEVVGAGIDQGTGLPWLAMELLHGEDLDHVVMARGALPIPEVLQLFQQLCHAVGAAHKVGVVHRDLKPENIFLAKARRADASFMVKVLDFGIAKIVAEASTKQTAAMGSPIWMAPEQADQSPITPATDVWALGLIAFFLLTGRPYWRSANDESSTIPMVLKEVLFEPLLPASVRTAELGHRLPPGFDDWFARCVTRPPASRFADATEAGAALMAALGGAPMSAMSSQPYDASGRMPQMGSGPSGFGSGPQPPYGTPLATFGSGSVQPYPQQQGQGQPQQAQFAGGTAAMRQGTPAGVPGGATGPAGAYALPEAAAGPKKLSPAIAAAIVIAVAALGVVGVLAVVKGHASSGGGGTTTGQGTDQGPDMATVAEAKKLNDEGKFDQAHQRLAGIPAGSDARQSQLFKDIEFKWATETLLLADRTSDVPTRRVLLDSVAQCTSVDDTIRSSARDRIAALDSPPPIDGGVSNASLSLAGLHGGGHKGIPGVLPSSGTTPPSPPPSRTMSELAASTSQADWDTVRHSIEPRLKGGTATTEEAHALQVACEKENDRSCVKSAKAYLKKH